MAERTSLPLWPLPLLAGVLPAVAALLAWGLSTHLGLIPLCCPFFDGCVSVSRAARHELPNHLFRALVVPAAVLQGISWLLLARWLLPQAGPGRGLRWLAPLGLAAALALVLYASFLGTEGGVYRALRRYGTVVYFGFSCIALLVAGGAVQRLADAGVLRLSRTLRAVMQAAGVALVLLGLANVFVGLWAAPALADRVENVAEWWGAAILVAGFLAIAALWKRGRLRFTLSG